MSENDHSLVFTAEDHTITHPEQDRDGCDFDAYIASDWTQPFLGLGEYLFTWHEGGPEQPNGYWNGTYIG